eukprot:g6556.t1
MYFNPTSVVQSFVEEESKEEDIKDIRNVNPRTPVSQCAFKNLLRVSVKSHTGLGYPRIRSFGELSQLEYFGIDDFDSSYLEEETETHPLKLSTSSKLLTNEDTRSPVEMTMLALWENCFAKNLFRYDVTACSTKTLSGVYGFIAQLNEGRATKKRPTEFRVDQVLQSFDEDKFHFGKAFMQEVLFQFDTDASMECLIEEDVCAGRSPNLVMINVSPIEYGHVLLVPKVLDRLTQIVTSETMLLALQFTVAVDSPYFRLGYNSLGAYATINHLHYQGYYLMAPYPVERAVTEELTGHLMVHKKIRISQLKGYPVKGWVFEMMEDFDECVAPMASVIAGVCEQLQEKNIAHNLLISDCGARVFLWPQCFAKKQAAGLVSTEILATGVNPACFEIAGHVILKNKVDYETFSQKKVWDLLSEVSLSDTEFTQLTTDCLVRGN